MKAAFQSYHTKESDKSDYSVIGVCITIPEKFGRAVPSVLGPIAAIVCHSIHLLCENGEFQDSAIR